MKVKIILRSGLQKFISIELKIWLGKVQYESLPVVGVPEEFRSQVIELLGEV